MKRLLTIYTALLLGLTAALANPNTMYFMEYLPYQAMMNPALQPRCKSYVELPLISTISASASTGGLTLNDFFYIKDGKLVTFLHPEYGTKEAVYSKLMRAPGFDAEVDLSLLGFGFRLKEKGYVTINASLRANTAIGMPSDIFTLGMYGTPDTVNVNSYDIDMPISMNVFLDLSGGYSQKINDQWTAGGRVHLLYGLANARLKSDDLALDMSHQEWKLSGTVNGNMSVIGVGLDTDENGNVTGFSTPSSMDNFFKTLDCSFGASLDLGAVYKPVPELKISLSVKDLGFIVWKTNATKCSGSIEGVYTGVGYPLSDEDFSSTLEVGQLTATKGTYTTMMNGKIYAGVEYDFLNNMMSLGLVSKTSYNYSHWNEEITVAYNLRPCSWFGLSASYSLISGRSSTLGLGVNLRIPPFSIYAVSDYTPVHYTSSGIPYRTSAVNVQAGIVLTFGCMKKKVKEAAPEEQVVLEEKSAEESEEMSAESVAESLEEPQENEVEE